jgi:hypothetical protein
MENLNLDKRTQVLEYALHIEESINTLLLLCLGIKDKSKTRLFGNKAGISFQSKIDLLYDIDILTKEENQNFELQMIFRNKFLHDIQFNTYTSILEYLENGIKNRFKKFLLEGGDISEEFSCREAYEMLFLSNMKVILGKINLKQASMYKAFDLLTTPTKLSLSYNDAFFDLIMAIYHQLEDSKLEIPEVLELVNEMRSTCQEHASNFISDERNKLYHDYYSSLSLNRHFKT